jgi:hypothetical protein
VSDTPLQDGARRALTLLAGFAHEIPEIDDPDWIVECLGENDFERYLTTVALCGIVNGVVPDLAAVVQRLGLKVDLLDQDNREE